MLRMPSWQAFGFITPINRAGNQKRLPRRHPQKTSLSWRVRGLAPIPFNERILVVSTPSQREGEINRAPAVAS